MPAGAAASVAGDEADAVEPTVAGETVVGDVLGADGAGDVDGADEPIVAGETVVGGVLGGDDAAGADDGAVSHDGGRLAFELGPISSALSGVEDEGATMLDGIEPKPAPADGAIVAPRSLRSCAGLTGTLKVGWYNSLYCCIGI